MFTLSVFNIYFSKTKYPTGTKNNVIAVAKITPKLSETAIGIKNFA